jgi:hypothetical protein
MRRGIWGYAYWATAAFGLLGTACEEGGVGDPCIPEVEYELYFNNFSEKYVQTEARSFQCETRLCLVNQFRGRVTCPYGQKQEDIDNTGNLSAEQHRALLCKIPGTSGTAPNLTDPPTKVSGEVIQVPVEPALAGRPPDRAVYCSCRCKNDKGETDDGANYCECPSGYTCSKLVPNPDLGKEALTGYYCIKSGSQFRDEIEACKRPVDEDGKLIFNSDGKPAEGNCEDHYNP